jgi:uncharacterized repeat protein (TIGR03803 family)
MRKKEFFRITVGILATVLVTLILSSSVWAQTTFKTLHDFKGGGKDGASPQAGLVFDTAGNLYGTTLGGGAYSEGAVFKLTPNGDGTWTESTLYSFCSQPNCADGYFPRSDLILDHSGNLYGTTVFGGSAGYGAVFELTPGSSGWTETVLYSFTGGADGIEPEAGLIFDGNGNLYGTTEYGGSAQAGVVFELTPGSSGWTETVLYTFCSLQNCDDGEYPYAGLVFDGNGNLYGTTVEGGVADYGVVFELTPGSGGWTERVLHSFDYHDGAEPLGRLAFDKVGNLYGTTSYGGGSNLGVIFQLTPNSHGKWSERVLHAFRDGKDGGYPVAGLVFDAAGNLCGTAYQGGVPGYGTVFKLTPTSTGGWTFRTLHQFIDHPGASPAGDLVVDGAGNIYGTASGTGYATLGSVWEITP